MTDWRDPNLELSRGRAYRRHLANIADDQARVVERQQAEVRTGGIVDILAVRGSIVADPTYPTRKPWAQMSGFAMLEYKPSGGG